MPGDEAIRIGVGLAFHGVVIAQVAASETL